MTEDKRKRGRPRKNPELVTRDSDGDIRVHYSYADLKAALDKAELAKNPDCEPATKAYVKCIARKLQKSSEHEHQTYLGWGIVVTGILSALALMCGAGSLTDINWTTIGFVFAILALVRMFEWFIGEDHNTTKSNGIADIPQIKKYEPPVCKDKQECD